MAAVVVGFGNMAGELQCKWDGHPQCMARKYIL